MSRIDIPPSWSIVIRKALTLEADRDAAAASGDREKARALDQDLLACLVRADAVLAGLGRRRRNPSAQTAADARALVAVDVPGDRVDDQNANPVLSVPGGALAVPLWQLDIAPSLKFTGAELAACAERLAAGRGLSGVDLTAVMVDCAGADHVGALHATHTDLARKLSVATEALKDIEGLTPDRKSSGDRRRALSARFLIESVVINEQSVSRCLAFGNWSRNARYKKRAREVIAEGLDAVRVAWADQCRGQGSIGLSRWISASKVPTIYCGDAQYMGPQAETA